MIFAEVLPCLSQGLPLPHFPREKAQKRRGGLLFSEKRLHLIKGILAGSGHLQPYKAFHPSRKAYPPDYSPGRVRSKIKGNLQC
jgi:hypothetical protein